MKVENWFYRPRTAFAMAAASTIIAIILFIRGDWVAALWAIAAGGWAAASGFQKATIELYERYYGKLPP